MRRGDRQVTDELKISEIINKCDCCRIGLVEDGLAYIVPLNFACEQQENQRTFYFHSGYQGRKIDLISQTGQACFEMDTGHELIVSERACGHSYRYQSIMGTGKISLVADEAEKQHGLQLIMHKYTGKNDWTFPGEMLKVTAVIKLTVQTLACKERP